MKTQWVKSLRPGLQVASNFGVFELGLAKNKNGAKYLRATLGDRTGMIEARVWDSALAENLSRGISPGDVAIIGGTVVEFNGLQINVETCTKTDRSQVDLDDYRPCCEQDTGVMLARFTAITGQVGDPSLRALLEAVFTLDLLPRFTRATAARVIHHAYSGGLLEHTLEVLEYCLKILEIQGALLNPDMLLTGAALHDIGKLWEYDQADLAFQRTDAGRLLGGHVILGRDFIRQCLATITGFPGPLALHLEHLVLSHHGQRDWGAVEEPHTLEAIALHQADLLSARLNQAAGVLRSQPSSSPWTQYDRHLGRSLYAPDRADEEAPPR
ncbi:MAG: HD domain-containing protein [Thermacetogeniaceae bacterium]